jgi:hypothetical protein
MTSIALWVAGIALLAFAALRMRAPLGRMSELDHLAENAKRYDSWRGGSQRTAAGGETTGADVMREMLRRQVYIWAVVAIVAVVLIVAGFAVH